MLVARRQLRLAIAVLLIIAAVVIWSTLDNGSSTASKSNSEAATDIDFFILDADFKAFGSDGKLSQIATSPTVKHFQQSRQSILLTPEIISFQDNQKSATITSQSAVADDSSGTITFNTKVLVTSFKETVADSFLNTTILHYNRSSNSIYSEEHVEFTDIFGSITTATGLFADIQLNTLELKNNVKGKIHAQ
ncbi:MAG: hypothetical protein OFPI_33040 [Osedax symbiont Rs2]|nr:MAG: hypothetical protein OFPI_33040 [Osedax symbiont Rs2]